MDPVPFHGTSPDGPSDGKKPADRRRDGMPRLVDRATQGVRRTSSSSTLRSTRLPSDEDRLAGTLRFNRREVFKQMVVAQLEAGFLRYSSRQALMEYAGKLGISPFDATLLIAEAQFYADRIDPQPAPLVHSHLFPAGDEEPAGSSESFTCRLMFAGTVALLIDLLLVYWLVG